MKVQQISVNARYSKALGPGEHKTLELGLQATLEEGEDWALAQQGLYAMLAQQLRGLWSQNGPNPDHAQNGSEKPIAGTWEQLEVYPSPTPKPVGKAHWCAEHEVEFKQHEKDGRSWFSHQQGDRWCQEGGRR